MIVGNALNSPGPGVVRIPDPSREDPAVKAGRLEVEVLSWWVEKGALTFPVAESMARQKKK